jgi:hypothetical protein
MEDVNGQNDILMTHQIRLALFIGKIRQKSNILYFYWVKYQFLSVRENPEPHNAIPYTRTDADDHLYPLSYAKVSEQIQKPQTNEKKEKALGNR